jgi:NtrC-family two-component system sensor histidine kinase KinB
MITTLRTKLLLGLTPLLFINVGVGLWAIFMLDRLGGRIDVILRENYRSVLAAEGMKEALERMDSSLLFAISGGDEAQARALFQDNRPRFQENLEIEQRNVTIEGEQQLADDLASRFAGYLSDTDRYFALPPTAREERSRFYFDRMLPAFNAIKSKADKVLEINQRNMEYERDRARGTANSSIRLMIIGLIGAAAVATLVAFVLSRSILGPIRGVTRGARAMARGELDQVVPVTSRDEVGELAQAFNTMARTIREFREAGTARLLRAQKTTQATIDSFPDPVVVVDNSGSVERTNPAARRILRVAGSPDIAVPWSPPPMLRSVLDEVLAGKPDYLSTTLDHALIFRDDGQERFFLPRVLAIRGDDGAPLGAAVVLTDVTRFRLMDQLKNDMVATVSHELKTPLTGVQMAVYLLLEEAVGPLNPKQIELLLAARQDSDRLLGIVNDLLDLTRIEQGRVSLDLKTVSPSEFVGESIDRFSSRAEDAGVDLRREASSDLPKVRADPDRVAHVFDNLLANALAHTPRGGKVTLGAVADPIGNGFVRFHVTDSGVGIPAEHLSRIFDKFYRVPGSPSKGGAGLGLAIAREIVTAHGGQIEAKSVPHAGTTFTFTLPIAPA